MLQNLLKNLLEHLPRICDFIHDLAEHLDRQVHVEDDLRVVGEDLKLLDQLCVDALVLLALLGLVLDLLD